MPLAERIARADAALDAVLMQPDLGRRLAGELLEEKSDDEAAAIAYRALGLAWKETGRLARAVGSLRRAITVAERAGVPVRAAQARMSLVVILSDQGRTEAALAEAALAERVLTGLDRARLLVNLGLVLQRTGRTKEALAAFAESQPVLQQYDDTRWESILLNLRGIFRVYQGAGREARQDLLRGEQLTRENGYVLLNAIIQGNLGFAACRAGDLPDALDRLDASVEALAGLDKPIANTLIDRSEALLLAGLGREARQTVLAAIAEQERIGFRYDLAENHLMLGRAALVDADPAAAEQAARTARQMFARQRRDGWVALARHIEVSARFAGGERSARLLREAVEVADRLRTDGWSVAPHEARLLAGRIAVELGRDGQAMTLLAEVARHRSRGVAEVRALAWHAHALHALAAGRRAAAERALLAGLRVLAENNAVLGATDLRAHASARGEELATLGLRLAVERGDARAVLRWAETWRAASLRRRPVRPPDDARLADDLAALRRVVGEIADAETPARGAGRAEVSRLHVERLRLEQAVRDRSRYARGTYAPEPPFSPTALAAALGERVLVEFVRLDDDLHAVTVRGGRVRRHRLGSYAAVLKQLDVVRFAMNRMSRRFGSEAVQAAAVQAYDHSRGVLDGLLFGGLRTVVGGGGEGAAAGAVARSGQGGSGGDSGFGPVPSWWSGAGSGADTGSAGSWSSGAGPAAEAAPELVIVPTGSLHALPWTALPSCAGRPVSVTPSARLWLAAAESAEAAAAAEVAAPTATGRAPHASSIPHQAGLVPAAQRGGARAGGPYRATAGSSDQAIGSAGQAPPPAAKNTARPVLMAGPGLDHAEPEIAALAERYPDAVVLTGADATAAATAAALDGVALAHVATHGRFRADHPLFSSLDAADGPLYVYDLERLGATPQLLVLSACESALSGVRPGDELMGLASAVFALGTRTLIASVTPVNDADTRTLMLALHGELAAGRPPAAALAAASAATGVGGFVCFGFGG